MITINKKEDCCGCEACFQICPQECISMIEDSEGFIYPQINNSKCIACNLCEKVCPIINKKEPYRPLKVYAAKNRNEEIRKTSSSGGIFTAIAENIIKQEGVVFGVSFDTNWNVVHSYTETIEGLSCFRGSKYVQSKIGDSYKLVRSYLKSGKIVLFTGTPCQISGLKNFLCKEYENLITIDILCHGVPSPQIWKKYLKELKNKHEATNIKSVNFRDKKDGWSKFNLSIEFNNNKYYIEPFNKDIYFKGFLSNLYLRPSCYSCKTKNGRSGSDITIGDYWNINEASPEFNDNKGISLVLINTRKGENLYNHLNIDNKETNYEVCIPKNGGFNEKLKIPRKRKVFFKQINQKKRNLSQIIENNLKVSLAGKLKKLIIKFIP